MTVVCVVIRPAVSLNALGLKLDLPWGVLLVHLLWLTIPRVDAEVNLNAVALFDLIQLFQNLYSKGI